MRCMYIIHIRAGSMLLYVLQSIALLQNMSTLNGTSTTVVVGSTSNLFVWFSLSLYE